MMEDPNIQDNSSQDENNKVSLEGVSDWAVEQIKNQLEDDVFMKGIIDDLTNNPKYKPFFEQYNEFSRKPFIQSYAHKRLLCKRHGQMYLKRREQNQLQYIQEAYECLSEINQKKIFDKQCLWRAEQIQIQGIAISDDFRFWEHYPMFCPFIDPITLEDVQLYKKYMLSDEYYHREGWYEWQDYDSIKKAFDNTDSNEDSSNSFMYESVPEWYEFHDFHKGVQPLLLPNIRGDKEEFYKELVSQKNYQKYQEEKRENPPPAPDRRPSLFEDEDENVYKFVRLFDTRETLDCLIAIDEDLSVLEDEDFEQACDYLLNFAPDYVITKQGNWRDLIIEAAETHRRHTVAAMLDAAYEEYLFKLEMGLLAVPPKESKKDYSHKMAKLSKQQIIEGRILNGEKPNLDF